MSGGPSDPVRRELVALLPRLRRFARSLTRNMDEADDLVQGALERALRNLGAWTPGTRLAMETHLEAQAVRAAMADLPDDQRIAVALVLIEGFSYREAADMLDVPIGTLTSRLARGRAAIEARLTPGHNEASGDA